MDALRFPALDAAPAGGSAMAAARMRLAVAALALGAAAGAWAWPQAGTPAGTVEVRTTRDPVDKSYRKMVAGMDRFAREHALAPRASLRFRVLPRLPNTHLDDLRLRVAGDTMSIPLPLDADHSFTLPRDARALREDAAVLANRRTSSLTWRAWVQTPGLPAGARRLGDLRLECKVGMDAGLVSNTAPAFAWLNNLLTSTDEVCGAPDGNYLFFAERPIFGVRLRAPDGRQAELPFRMLYAGGRETPATLPYCDCQVLLDRSYFAPIWDRAWPDDTLVEFAYMDEPPEAAP